MKKLSQLCLWLGVLGSLLGASLANEDHFCNRTVSKVVMRPVSRERTIITQPKKWKFWAKPNSRTEQYTTEEKHIIQTVVRECCTGYRLTDEAGLCEPVCLGGCPAHASCVGPQRCQCMNGYVTAQAHRDGSHFCQPVCSYPCNKNAYCVAPNTCSCRSGYREQAPTDDGVSGQCVPICQLGNSCANGRCVQPERCECHANYQWDVATQHCLLAAESQGQPLLPTESDEAVSEATPLPTTPVMNCSAGFVLYENACRPATFDSSQGTTMAAQDCRQADMQCGQHQACNEQNGNCICAAGYMPVVDSTTESSSQSLICHRASLKQQRQIDQAVDDAEASLLIICIIALCGGTVILLSLVAAVVVRRHRKQTQAAATLPEKGMQCKFSQKSYDVDEMLP